MTDRIENVRSAEGMEESSRKEGGDSKIAGVPSVSGLVASSPFIPRNFSNIMSIGLGVLAITVLIAYSLKPTAPYVVGENLVLAEVYLPGFVIKPITLFTYLFFCSYAFGLSSPISKARFLRMGETLFEAIYVLAWFFVMLSGFEVLYQIVLWSAALSVQGLQNPDIIVNWWPQNPYAINVVFAAKLVVLIFAISCFSVDYLQRIRRARERVQSNSAGH
jgi:hypothetical protein